MQPVTFSPFGKDLFGEQIQPNVGKLKQEFIMPPFSVFNARDGEWQERKAAWLALGIKSEIGRLENSIGYSSAASLEEKDTSIFDPVLCELLVSWFSRKADQIIDPFAGGSVRGIVAAILERRYWGCELSAAQVAANYENGNEIVPAAIGAGSLYWREGDSMEQIDSAPEADFILGCPPYGDLEVYSDNPADLSAMEYHTFKAAYGRIILKACKKLKEERFAAFVVGNYRDEKGFLRNFVGDTISAFENAGLKFYNSAVLVTAVGSSSMRARRIFDGGRKLCGTHQAVLVFCKGDWKKAAKRIF